MRLNPFLLLQMKERYATAKPYGQWLDQQTATIADICASVECTGSSENGNVHPTESGSSQNGSLAVANGTGSILNGSGEIAQSNSSLPAYPKGLQRLLKPLKVSSLGCSLGLVNKNHFEGTFGHFLWRPYFRA